MSRVSPSPLPLPPQVCAALHPRIPPPVRAAMVSFNEALSSAVVSERRFARAGGPWEFNLRDVLRWSELSEAAVPPRSPPSSPPAPLSHGPPPADFSQASDESDALRAAVAAFFPVVYTHRLRTAADRAAAASLFSSHFPASSSPSPLLAALPSWPPPPPAVRLSSSSLTVGCARATRFDSASAPPPPAAAELLMLRRAAAPLEAAVAAVDRGWMVSLVGPSGAGKNALARTLAALVGATLHEVRAARAWVVCVCVCGMGEMTTSQPTLLCPTAGDPPALGIHVFFTLN